MLKEFKPSVIFLVKFLVLYLVLNFVYGIFINFYGDIVDPITYSVTSQSAYLLGAMDYDVFSYSAELAPKVFLNLGERSVLSVYEGCNGVNVMIIFIAFIASFSKPSRQMGWFVPLGLLVIHIFNLGRIVLLFFVTENFPNYLYFTHKYFFTAIIYLVVFFIWFIWVVKINVVKSK